MIGRLSRTATPPKIADKGEGAFATAIAMADTAAIDLTLSEHPLTTFAVVRHSSSVRSGFEFVGLTTQSSNPDHERHRAVVKAKKTSTVDSVEVQ
jgi:hypothetical protein